MSEQPAWIGQLERWRDDGTFDRLLAAQEDQVLIKIRRSSGAMQDVTISGFGHAGRSACVTWTEEGGELSKVVSVEDLLAWNPAFVGVERGGGMK